MKRAIEYDQQHSARYVAGRALCGDTGSMWMKAVARHVTKRQGMTILDLGAGTGRFAPLLADTFDADVLAVDPSTAMLSEAMRVNPHPRVRYVPGSAEDLPASDRSIDLVFASMAVHHFSDRAAAARELWRVLGHSGIVCIRNSFAGRLQSVRYYKFFPEARIVDEQRLPTVDAVRQDFESCGLQFVALEPIEQVIDLSLGDHLQRLRHRATSTLELISDREFEAGLERLRRAAELERVPGPVTECVDLLVFRRP